MTLLSALEQRTDLLL